MNDMELELLKGAAETVSNSLNAEATILRGMIEKAAKLEPFAIKKSALPASIVFDDGHPGNSELAITQKSFDRFKEYIPDAVNHLQSELCLDLRDLIDEVASESYKFDAQEVKKSVSISG